MEQGTKGLQPLLRQPSLFSSCPEVVVAQLLLLQVGLITFLQTGLTIRAQSRFGFSSSPVAWNKGSTCRAAKITTKLEENICSRRFTR